MADAFPCPIEIVEIACRGAAELRGDLSALIAPGPGAPGDIVGVVFSFRVPGGGLRPEEAADLLVSRGDAPPLVVPWYGLLDRGEIDPSLLPAVARAFTRKNDFIAPDISDALADMACEYGDADTYFRLVLAGDHAVILRQCEFDEDILADAAPEEDAEIAPLVATKARIAVAPAASGHERLARRAAMDKAIDLLSRLEPIQNPRTGAALVFTPSEGPRT